MKIVADENIDSTIISFLRGNGYDVISIAEDFAGNSDEKIAALVNHHKALFLTGDKNFVDVLFWRKQYRYGVVLIRLDDALPDIKGQIILKAIAQHTRDMAGAITSISSRSVRIRKFLKI